MTEETAVTAPHPASYPKVYLRPLAAFTLLALLVYLSPNLDTDLWLAPLFCIGFCLLYFRPLLLAVLLATIALVDDYRFVHRMMTAVVPDWSIEPYYFEMRAVLFTLFIVMIAVGPFMLMGITRLAGKKRIGKGYGWKTLRIDVSLALVLYATVLSVLYAGTHTGRYAAVSELYRETLNLTLSELEARAKDASLSDDQRAAAIYAIAGFGIDRDRLEEREEILRRLQLNDIDEKSFEAFAMKFALRITELPLGEEDGSIPSFYRRMYREGSFFSFYDSYYRFEAKDEDTTSPEVSSMYNAPTSAAAISC